MRHGISSSYLSHLAFGKAHLAVNFLPVGGKGKAARVQAAASRRPVSVGTPADVGASFPGLTGKLSPAPEAAVSQRL